MQFDFPLILTGEVTDIDSGGVTFHAMITDLSKSGISEYGFAWGLEPIPDINSSHVIYGKINSTGEISSQVVSDLAPDAIYNVRAFAKNEAYITYGQKRSFKSLGSHPPVITGFSPAAIARGDSVRIFGNYFSTSNDNNFVKLAGKRCEVIRSEINSITVNAPSNVSGKLKIYVDVAGRTAISENFLDIYGPFINYFFPNRARGGDQIEITGGNFSDQGTVKAWIGHIEAEAIFVSPAKIRVIIPPVIAHDTTTLRIMTSDIITEAPYEIAIYSPWSWIAKIQIAPIYAAVGFSLGNKLYFGFGNGDVGDNFNEMFEFEPSSSSRRTITDFPGKYRTSASSFVIGNNAYICQGWNYRYGVAIDTWSLSIEGTWTQKANFPINVTRGSGFAIDGNGYVYSNSSMYKYSPDQNSWSRIESAPAFGYYDVAFGCSYQGKGYLVVYDYVAAYSKYGIWEYEPGNDNWRSLALSPDSARTYPVAFIIDDKIHVGMGWYVQNNTLTRSQKEFYEYSISTNQWRRITDFPTSENTNPVAMNIGRKGYVVATFSPLTGTIWEFNPD